MFFGSYTPEKSTEGIYVYQLDTIKGKLSKITSIKNISNPSYLSLSNDGQFLYACTESRTPNAGSVSSFKFNPKKMFKISNEALFIIFLSNNLHFYITFVKK